MLEDHALLHGKCIGIFDQLFAHGVTFLNPEAIASHAATQAEQDTSLDIMETPELKTGAKRALCDV